VGAAGGGLTVLPDSTEILVLGETPEEPEKAEVAHGGDSGAPKEANGERPNGEEEDQSKETAVGDGAKSPLTEEIAGTDGKDSKKTGRSADGAEAALMDGASPPQKQSEEEETAEEVGDGSIPKETEATNDTGPEQAKDADSHRSSADGILAASDHGPGASVLADRSSEGGAQTADHSDKRADPATPPDEEGRQSTAEDDATGSSSGDGPLSLTTVTQAKTAPGASSKASPRPSQSAGRKTDNAEIAEGDSANDDVFANTRAPAASLRRLCRPQRRALLDVDPPRHSRGRRRAPRRQTRSAEPPPTPPPAEELKTRALHLEPLADLPDTTYAELGGELRADRDHFAEDIDFNHLPGVGRAIAHVDNEREAARKKSTFRELDAIHQADLAAIKEDIEYFDGETEQLLGDGSEVRNEEQRILLENQQSEEQKLVEKWRSPRYTRRYNHPSNPLIAARKQFEYVLKSGDYFDAELCHRQLTQAEVNASRGATAAMRTEFKEAKRLLKIKHNDRLEQLRGSLDTDTGVLTSRRKIERNILENVEKKVNVDIGMCDEDEKAWILTRTKRMTQISKKPKDFPIVIPAGNRESVRAVGRFERQAVPIKLEPLDFEKL
jgi:hypothetical protein